MFAGATLSPAANIAIIVFATIAAILLVPEDVQPAGALDQPALAMAFGLAAAIFLRIWTHPVAAFDPLNVVTASPIYWLLLDPLQGAYDLPDLTQAEVQGTFLVIGLFATGVWIAALHRPWRIPQVVQQAATIRLTSNALFSIATVAFVLGFLRFAIPAGFDLPEMWSFLFKSRWEAPWGRGMLGGWEAFLDHFAYFGYVLPTLAVLLARSAGWFNGRTLVAIGYALVILALLSTGGGRRIIGVLAGSAFVVWFFSAHNPRLKHLLVVVGLAVMLLGFMQLMINYRGVGIGRAFLTTEDQTLVKKLEYLHVDDNFLRTCQIIKFIPDQHPHVTWRWLLWVAARPIPRVFWEGKPISPGFDLTEQLGMQGLSLSCSLIGELYMAFGYVGCLAGGWFVGRFALVVRGFLHENPSPGSLVLFGAGLLALFAGMRSGIELVLMSYVMLAWIVLCWVYRQWRGV